MLRVEGSGPSEGPGLRDVEMAPLFQAVPSGCTKEGGMWGHTLPCTLWDVQQRPRLPRAWNHNGPNGKGGSSFGFDTQNAYGELGVYGHLESLCDYL